MISEDEEDEWKIRRVEGVDVVVPLGVLGGRVVRRRWMSLNSQSVMEADSGQLNTTHSFDQFCADSCDEAFDTLRSQG